MVFRSTSALFGVNVNNIKYVCLPTYYVVTHKVYRTMNYLSKRLFLERFLLTQTPKKCKIYCHRENNRDKKIFYLRMPFKNVFYE